MKTLLLTSQGMQVKDEIARILPKPPSETKLAHITTAAKGEDDSSYVGRATQEMEDFGFQNESIREGLSQTKYPLKILTDEQAILVQDGQYTLVGKGKEIKL